MGLYASDVQKWSFAHFSVDSGVSYDFTIYNDALTSSAILVKGSNSNVLIGTTTDAGYKLDVNGTIRGSSFTKTGGTSSQFLKADGSVDSSTYLTTGTAASTYVPYTGATGNVDLGTRILSANNLIANGGFNSGALLLKNANAASLIDTGYFKFSPSSSNTQISFGFSTGASTWKQFSFSSHLITDNTITIFSLPNGGGTLALTTDIPANPVGGTGTTNYVSKFTGASAIGNSQIIDNGSQVGIGINPQARLQIFGGTGAYPTLGTNVTNSLFISRNDGAVGMYLGYFSDGNGWIQQMRNDSAFAYNLVLQPVGGNVGIGTPSPGYRLVVNSATDGISAGIAGSTYGIRFDNGGTFSSGMSTIHGVNSTLIGSYQPIMLNGLDVRFGTSATERMRIFSDGNVLIQSGGTFSNNGARLQVSGAGRFSGNLTLDTSSLILGLGNGGSNEAVYFNYNSNAASRSWRIVKDWTAFGDFQIQQSTTQTGTTYADILRFSPTGAATFSNSVTVNNGAIEFGGSGSAPSTDPAIYRVGGLNDMAFSIGSTPRMTIKSGGNVLIGTTTDNGAKLQVNGDSGYSKGIVIKNSNTSSSNFSVLTLEANTDGYPIVEFKEGATQKWQIYNDWGDDSLNFYKWVGTAGTVLSLASTGAATFSSRINGVVGGTAYNTAGLWLQGSSSTDGIAIGGTAGGDKNIDTYGGTLKINSTSGNGLSVTGAATFSSSVTAASYITSSDARLKKVISKDGDLAIYSRLDSENIHYGYIAQDMQKDYPNQVHTDNKGFLSLNYVEILVKKVNDLEKKIKELKQEIDTLKN